MRATSETPVVAAHPVTLTARLDPRLSRWQWLVKWILVLPHLVVLTALWGALIVTTVVAAASILVRRRFPKSLFEFNVGVLRWTWRVAHYAGFGGLATDRYPPFTLLRDRDDHAAFDVTYTRRRSRVLVLTRWFLVLPHVAVIAVLAGGSVVWIGTGGLRPGIGLGAGLGLPGLLVIFAGFQLLFTGRYPLALFDLIVGLNRWVFRVLAYVTLLTDTYPPFRLDLGGAEPGVPPRPLAKPEPTSLLPGNWTVPIGSVTAMPPDAPTAVSRVVKLPPRPAEESGQVVGQLRFSPTTESITVGDER